MTESTESVIKTESKEITPATTPSSKIPTIAPPDLPKETSPSKTESLLTSTPTSSVKTTKPSPKPIGYSPVKGTSQSVSSKRYNPITPVQKPSIPVDSIKDKQQKSPPPLQKDDEAKTVEENADNVVNIIPTQQQQQIAAQQIAAQMAAASNPMLAQMAMMQQQQQQQQLLNNQSNHNKKQYAQWPQSTTTTQANNANIGIDQSQYLQSFNPWQLPLDATTATTDYNTPYQLGGYLGTTASANQNAMAQLAQLQSLGGLGAMNPLLAAQATAMQNPLLLAATQSVFNPLLAASSTNSAAVAAALSGNTMNNLSNVVGMNNLQNPLLNVAASANNAALNMAASANMSGKQFSLFVFHLPEDIDDHGLLQLFAPYGAMRSNVMRHDTGRSRGFGFVHFNSRHEAQIAIDMMNGHQIGRKRLRVSFKREEAHNQHRGQQQHQQQQQHNGLVQLQQSHVIPTSTLHKTE